MAPLAIAIAMAAGLRYLFSLPLALGANWLFQMTEPEDCGVWLSAVERFVLWCGIAPVFLAAFPAGVAVFGWVRAAGAMALAFLAVLIVFEILYRNWCKLPFTCSRLPGQEQALVTIARVFYAVVYCATVAQLILYSSGELTAFVALITFEAVVWLRLRAKRRGSWAQAEMAYEDTSEEAPISLQLPQTLETDAAPATAPTAAVVEPAMFSAGMVASRGILPAAWAEEIDAERSRPGALAGTLLRGCPLWLARDSPKPRARGRGGAHAHRGDRDERNCIFGGQQPGDASPRVQGPGQFPAGDSAESLEERHP